MDLYDVDPGWPRHRSNSYWGSEALVIVGLAFLTVLLLLCCCGGV